MAVTSAGTPAGTSSRLGPLLSGCWVMNYLTVLACAPAAQDQGVEQGRDEQDGAEGEELVLAALGALEVEEDPGVQPDDQQGGDQHPADPAHATGDGHAAEHGDGDRRQGHA